MGAKYAFSRSLKWIVLLDQDTSFNQNFIVQLNLSIQNSNAKLYAPLLKLQDGKSFSQVLYRNKRGYMRNFEPGEHPLKGISPVNSDLCILSDQDDKWVAGKVEAFMKEFENYDVIVSDHSLFKNDNEVIYKSFFSFASSKQVYFII